MEVAEYLWERGWAERNAGNISVDITGLVRQNGDKFNGFPKSTTKISEEQLAGRCFLVTATGSRLRELARQPEKNLLMISITDELDGYHCLWGGEGAEVRPTSEFVSHLKIHGFLRRNNFRQKAIIHTHPSYLIALTHIEQYNRQDALNHLLWTMHPEVKICLPEGVRLAPYRCPGVKHLLM